MFRLVVVFFCGLYFLVGGIKEVVADFNYFKKSGATRLCYVVELRDNLPPKRVTKFLLPADAERFARGKKKHEVVCKWVKTTVV